MHVCSVFPLFLGTYFYIYEIRIQCTTGEEGPNQIPRLEEHDLGVLTFSPSAFRFESAGFTSLLLD